MTTTIIERTFLPAPAEELYASYLDPHRHAKIIGAPVDISAEPGSAFTAFGGQVWGRTVYLGPGRLIVQEWGSDQLGPGHLVVLAFDTVEGGAEISLLHTGIPDDRRHLVDWEGRYWRPWRALLADAR
jgi:activator of HSP90 ATPase